MEHLIKNSRRHDITISTSGIMSLSARLVRMLDIQDGDTINVGCDKDNYYIYVAYRRQEAVRCKAKCYSLNKSGRCMRCCSKELAMGIINKVAKGQRTVKLPIGNAMLLNGRVAVPLITKLLL